MKLAWRNVSTAEAPIPSTEGMEATLQADTGLQTIFQEMAILAAICPTTTGNRK